MTASESQHWTRALLIALLLGFVAGSLALAYVTVEHWLQHLLWETLPELLGAESGEGAQWYLVLLLPAAGGLSCSLEGGASASRTGSLRR